MPAGTPLFDRGLMAKRRQRRHQPDANILTRTIAEELVERLSLVNRHFDHVLLIAAEPEHIAARLKETKRIGDITTRLPSTSDDLDLLDGQFDAVLSMTDLQCFNDVPGALIQMRRALKPDGLFLACLFAGNTLAELRQSWLAGEALTTGGVSPGMPANSEPDLICSCIFSCICSYRVLLCSR